jgi:hypothetical protein
MIKPRRLRKSREEKLPVIIYTDNCKPATIKRIKNVWAATTSWPCIVAGPGLKFSHANYSTHDYTIKENNESL